jgi:hypothetical protein
LSPIARLGIRSPMISPSIRNDGLKENPFSSGTCLAVALCESGARLAVALCEGESAV